MYRGLSGPLYKIQWKPETTEGHFYSDERKTPQTCQATAILHETKTSFKEKLKKDLLTSVKADGIPSTGLRYQNAVTKIPSGLWVPGKK